MKEHHDELLQNVTHLSHRYNELRELVKTKQQMITDEVTNSIEDIDKWFNSIVETKKKMLENIDKAKQDAQTYVQGINSDLEKISVELQSLTKEGIVQPNRIDHLSTELDRLHHDLDPYKAKRNVTLPPVNPQCDLKFDCGPSSTIAQPQASTLLDDYDRFIGSLDKYGIFMDSDNDDGSILSSALHIPTSYIIDCMACANGNIMYTSTDQPHHVIAFCRLDEPDEEDPYHIWNHSRVVDMIYWTAINKFVCASNDAVYTVAYIDNRVFDINCVLSKHWSYVRVAANTDHLWLWTRGYSDHFNIIWIYSSQFQLVRTIDFHALNLGPLMNDPASFCITDNNLVAAVYIRMQIYQKVFKAIYFDFDMNKMQTILLGECEDGVQIRTDGDDRFFVTTGRKILHIVSPDGTKETIALEKNASTVAVIDTEQILVTDGRDDMELLVN